MIFTTWVFAAFMLASVTVYWVCPSGWRKYALILSGSLFYAYTVPKYLLLVAGLSIAVYCTGSVMVGLKEKGNYTTPRLVMIMGIILCTLALVGFKYLKLITNTINQLNDYIHWAPSLPVVSLIAPLGISYFTFQFIHYLVDLGQGKIEPRSHSLGNLLSFTLFFPTLASGPIKRYQQFQRQIDGRPIFKTDLALEGMRRVIIGLGKKFIVADTVSQLTWALTSPETAGWWVLVAAVYAYTIKIYFDFAGYTDIAIGCSLLFGIRVPENFNSPYLKRNISEFWRSWHMSLSSWIRDYLYIPLGGSRVSLVRNVVNLVAVMAICGLWHGASWNFLVWGLWHGLGMGIHRLFKIYWGDKVKLPYLLAVGITFHYVALGWIFFSSPDIEKSLLIIQKIFFPWL